MARLAIEAGPSAGGAGRPLLAGSPPPPGTDAVAPWGTAAPTQLSRLAPALLEATTQELLQAVEGRVAASAARACAADPRVRTGRRSPAVRRDIFLQPTLARAPPYERPADAGGLVGKGRCAGGTRHRAFGRFRPANIRPALQAAGRGRRATARSSTRADGSAKAASDACSARGTSSMGWTTQ